VVIQERRLRIGQFYSRIQFKFMLASVPAAQILQQPHESKQFIPTGIRYGAVVQIAGLPEDKVITIARQLARQSSQSSIRLKNRPAGQT
jgi:hypothetical protein